MPMADKGMPTTSTHYRAVVRWWQHTGEPLALGSLLLVAAGVPLLVLAELLPLQTAFRVLLALAWLAGVLLLPRLSRLLRHEQRRIVVLVLIIAGTLAGVLAAGAGGSERAGAAHSVLPAAPQHMQQVPLAQDQGVTGLTFAAAPRISREMFAQLLQQGTGGGGTSPAAPEADELYDIIVGYGLDPAVALAFFAQESQFCTTGICASHDMHSWGGNRAAHDPDREAGIVQARSGPFVSYNSWEDGLRDWCELILNRYIGQGLDTVEKAVPVYAPAFDGNDPDAYTNAIRRRVAVWQGQDPGQFVDPSVHSYASLETGLLTETFMASGLEYNPQWAFHRYMLQEAQAGRPLGSPLDDSRVITVNGQRYAIQTFALDTLYTPLADVESETNWSDVRRLSDLLAPSGASGTPTPAPPPPTATPVPTPTEIPVPGVHTLR